MMKIAIITVLLGAVYFSQAEGSCAVWQNFTSGHTCGLPKTGTEVTEAEKAEILAYHNQVRSDVDPPATDMLVMTWDDKLQDLAQRWADNCVWAHDNNNARNMYGYYPVGQNMALRMHSSAAATNWASAMFGWAEELTTKSWSYGAHPVAGAGHYTQMIWAGSSKIGCGMAQCPTTDENYPFKYQYVCNYGPAGNVGSQKPYTMGASPASACPSYKVGNLCDCDGKVCRNTGTLNVGTCTCSCPSTTHMFPDDCAMNCAVNGESVYGGACAANPSYCTAFSNWGPEYCPWTCNYCPALANV